MAPGFEASILHRDIVGPYEMEQEYGLIGGNIFHGELTLEQLFHMRPAPGYADYRTPITGLYYGSSATHAGGGVCGIPGWQAARAAIADSRPRAGQVSCEGSPGGHDGGNETGGRATTPGHRRPTFTQPAYPEGPTPAAEAALAMLEARSRRRSSAPQAAPGAPSATHARGGAASPGPARNLPGQPAHDEIGGRRAFPSLADLPEPVDLALLGVPDARARASS